MAASRSCGDLSLALALRRHSRPLTALVDLLSATDIEIADLPAACNSSRRRSSSWVQCRYFVAAMLGGTEKSGNHSWRRPPGDSGPLINYRTQFSTVSVTF